MYDWAFPIRALLKMQSKGVVQLEFISSSGIISQNNIDRFHITLFGQNLLEHIKVDEWIIKSCNTVTTFGGSIYEKRDNVARCA